MMNRDTHTWLVYVCADTIGTIEFHVLCWAGQEQTNHGIPCPRLGMTGTETPWWPTNLC